MLYDTTKADWKLFQEKLPNWQENFMKKLNNEYIQLLSGPKHDSEKYARLMRSAKLRSAINYKEVLERMEQK